MNRTFILTMAAAALSVVTVAGCKSNTSLSEKTPDAFASIAEPETDNITHEYNITNFTGITANGAVNIRFTQGSSYSVKIVGLKDKTRFVSISKTGDFLNISTNVKSTTVNNSKTTNYALNDPTPIVYVTAPHLETMRLMGVTSFSGGKLTAQNFTAEIGGASGLKFVAIKSPTVKISNSGASRFEASIEADSAEIKNSGASRFEASIEADSAEIKNSGASNAKIKFKGATLKLNNDGAAKITADVDCESVKGHNNGAGKITLTGSADKTSITTSGVSKNDFDGLNIL